MKIKGFIFVGCILALCCLLATPLLAQQASSVCDANQFFPQTGHKVCDQFLRFFNARGGVRIFGYPITERFVENGRMVQYFQRARMEHHPEHSSPYDVQLGLLGDFFAPEEKKNRIAESDRPKSNDPQRRYFPETGHTVGFGFLEFFDGNGGLDIFGYPVTEFMLESDRVVQYFQRALMEWDPNRSEIVLHNLGEYWVDQHRDLRSLRDTNPQLAPDSEPTQALPSVSDLRVTASIRHAFAGLGSEQTVWVYINDQSGRPVEGAQVMLIAPFLSEDHLLRMTPTDALGHTQTTFELNNLTPGELIIVDVRAEFEELVARARAFFFCWW